MQPEPLHLFQGFGVELEYMIVDARTLSVRPLSDRVLHAVAGAYESEVERGDIAWSNELALHVIELKTNGPARSLNGLAELFQQQVREIDALLQPLDSRLMPTAMHPWMDPLGELQLWPHEYNPVYEAYHRIFDCRGHGWGNLQSVHLNLPFANDEEFGRLHAAIRLLLPILPALAASSPVRDRRLSGLQDGRLEVYRGNSRRVASVTADVIPEPVFTKAEYQRQILQRMYADIAPFDPDGILQHEFLNARGAIARFDRQTIEIRILDIQECPSADLAICEAITSVLRMLCEEHWTTAAEQQSLATATLAELFLRMIRDAERATISDQRYLAQFGLDAWTVSAGEVWQHLIDTIASGAAAYRPSPAVIEGLQVILTAGPLSRRIERALAGDMDRLPAVYAELCDCLAAGRLFVPSSVA